MNNLTPLLPETTFKPLSGAKLDSMITNALSHRQLPAQAQIISFPRSWAHGFAVNAAYTAGLAAMAASVLMAFLVTPQYTASFSTQAQPGTDVAASDVSDLLLMDSFGT